MWEGKITEELRTLGAQYAEAHHGIWPDGYDELLYEFMSYDEFLGYIKEALEKGVELPDVVPG